MTLDDKEEGTGCHDENDVSCHQLEVSRAVPENTIKTQVDGNRNVPLMTTGKEAHPQEPYQQHNQEKERAILYANSGDADRIQRQLRQQEEGICSKSCLQREQQHGDDRPQSTVATLSTSPMTELPREGAQQQPQSLSQFEDLVTAKFNRAVGHSIQQSQLQQPGAYAQPGVVSVDGPSIVPSQERGTTGSRSDNSDSSVSDVVDAAVAVAATGDGDNQNENNDVDKELAQERPSSACVRRCIGMLVLVLLTVIAITVLLFFNPAEMVPQNEDYFNGNEEKYFRAKQQFVESLPIATQQAILDTSTPQFVALQVVQFEDDDSLNNALPNWKQTQRYATAVLYYSFFGSLPPDNNKDECDWLGHPNTCHHQSNIYEKLTIEVTNNSCSMLPRMLPREIGLLSRLESIQISAPTTTIDEIQCNILLEDWLPTEIYSLRNLTSLNMINLKLQGSIPTSVGKLSSLVNMDLSFNTLTGSLPSELAQLSHLDSLALDNNLLVGTIPTELFSDDLSDLNILRLDKNQLTGSIATEIGLLANLEYLNLGYNQLQGTMPKELAQNTKLTELTLKDNVLLTGPFPQALETLSTSLLLLDIRNTNITGEIPRQFCTGFSKKVLYADCDKILCCFAY